MLTFETHCRSNCIKISKGMSARKSVLRYKNCGDKISKVSSMLRSPSKAPPSLEGNTLLASGATVEEPTAEEMHECTSHIIVSKTASK